MPKFSKFEAINTTGIDANKEITEILPRLIDSVTKIVADCAPYDVERGQRLGRSPCIVDERSKRREGSADVKAAISTFNKIANSHDRFDPGNEAVAISLRRLSGALGYNTDYGSRYVDMINASKQDVRVKELMDGLIMIMKRANDLYYR